MDKTRIRSVVQLFGLCSADRQSDCYDWGGIEIISWIERRGEKKEKARKKAYLGDL
jgi:hypothetical protein